MKVSFPFLFITTFQILNKTSFTDTANWMRYVRLAETYSQQNLLLCESGGKLFFRSNQFIKSKQELRVGYGKEYAEKYGLKILEPSENEKKGMFIKLNFSGFYFIFSLIFLQKTRTVGLALNVI